MASGATLLFLRVAVQSGYVTKEQVNRVVQVQSERSEDGRPTTIPDILLEEGMLRPAQIQALVKAVRYMEIRAEDKIFGRLARQNGFVQDDDLERGLSLQKSRYEKTRAVPASLGDILIEQGVMTRQQVDSIRTAQNRMRHMTPSMNEEFSALPVEAAPPREESEPGSPAAPESTVEIYCVACGAVSHGEAAVLNKPYVCPACLETVVALPPSSARIRKLPAEETFQVVSKQDATEILDAVPGAGGVLGHGLAARATPSEDVTQMDGRGFAAAARGHDPEATEHLDPQTLERIGSGARTIPAPSDDATQTDWGSAAATDELGEIPNTPSSVLMRTLGAKRPGPAGRGAAREEAPDEAVYAPPERPESGSHTLARPGKRGKSSSELPAARAGRGAAAAAAGAPAAARAEVQATARPAVEEGTATVRPERGDLEGGTSMHDADGLTHLDVVLPGRTATKLRVMAILLDVASWVLLLLGLAIAAKVLFQAEALIAGLPRVAVATMSAVSGGFAFLLAQGVATLCRALALIDHAVRRR